MAETADVIEALKYTYGAEKLEMALNDKCCTWNLFQKQQVAAGGRGQFIVPLYNQLPEGISGITENGTLPSNVDPDTSEATFTLQEIAGVFNVSWKLLSDARNDRFAFQNAVEMQERGFNVAFCQDLGNEMLDDGRGRLAILPAADNTSAVTVSRPIRVRDGMVVDIMDTDDDTKHLDSGTVSAVDFVNNTVAVSGSITGTAASDYFVRQDTADDSVNDSLHLNGLLGIVDNDDPAAIAGDYGGIDRGTAGNEFWESIVNSNSGTNRTLTEDLILSTQMDIRLKGQGNPDVILCGPGVYRRYYELFSQDRFITVEQGNTSGMSGALGPKGGFSKTGGTSLMFSDMKVHMDDFAAANTMLLLDTSTFFIAHGQNKVPQAVSETFDRANFFAETSNAGFDVRWWWQGELVCKSPASNGKIEDISES